MSGALTALAVVLGTLAFAVAVSAMPAMWRAYRLGVPFWYGGLGWYGAPSRFMPEAARPHARHAMRRWFAAIGLFLLAAAAAIAANVLDRAPAP